MRSPLLVLAIGAFVAFFQNVARCNFDESIKRPNSAKGKVVSKPTLNASHLRQAYVLYCAHCHGLDGRPTALVEKVTPEIPDFSRFDWDDYDVSDVVGSIADGTGKMPGFKDVLTQVEMDSLAVMIAKFPRGKPHSFIEKTNRYRKADGKLVEKAKELEDRIQSLHN